MGHPIHETLKDQILRTVDDAVMRVGASANCYDVPADANSGAEYVAMRVRQILAAWVEKKERNIAPDPDLERFYFLDAYGDEAFIREADHKRIVREMEERATLATKETQ